MQNVFLCLLLGCEFRVKFCLGPAGFGDVGKEMCVCVCVVFFFFFWGGGCCLVGLVIGFRLC